MDDVNFSISTSISIRTSLSSEVDDLKSLQQLRLSRQTPTGNSQLNRRLRILVVINECSYLEEEPKTAAHCVCTIVHGILLRVREMDYGPT